MSAFLSYLGSDCCTELRDLTEEKLCSMIDYAAALDKDTIKEAARALKERENLNAVAAKALLTEE